MLQGQTGDKPAFVDLLFDSLLGGRKAVLTVPGGKSYVGYTMVTQEAGEAVDINFQAVNACLAWL